MHTKDLAIMFFPVLNRKVIQTAIEKLDAPITRSCEDLVLMDLRPCQIIQRVLSCEPSQVS